MMRTTTSDNEIGIMRTTEWERSLPAWKRASTHTITVGESAVDAHLRNHEDTLGPCP
jgi:hypothetical protein